MSTPVNSASFLAVGFPNPLRTPADIHCRETPAFLAMIVKVPRSMVEIIFTVRLFCQQKIDNFNNKMKKDIEEQKNVDKPDKK